MAITMRLPVFRRFLDSLRNELAVASMRSFALHLASKALMLLSSILLARWLGAEGFGIYASAIAAALVLSTVAGLGIPTLLIRLLPVYEVKCDWGLMRGILRYASSRVLASSIALASLTAALIMSMGHHLSGPQQAAFLSSAALIPIVTLSRLNASALRGLRHVIAGQLSETLVIPGLFVVMIAGWVILGARLRLGDLSAVKAVILMLAASTIAVLFSAFLLWRKMSPQIRESAPKYDRRAWFRAAVPFFLLSGATIVSHQTDVLMLVALESNAAAGVYQAAARGAELVAFSLVIVSSVVQPTIARLHELADLERLQVVLTAAARFAAVLALPVALMLAVFAQPILRLVYGHEFERGALCLIILSIAQIVNVSAGLVGNILLMTGHVRDAATGMILGAAVNISLNAALIPRWGIEGAAVATGTSLVVWNIFLTARVKSRVGVVSSVFATQSRSRLRGI